MADEAYVAVSDARAVTQNVRNITVQALQPDGTTVKVLMQVMSLADENGNVIDEFIDYNYQKEVLDKLISIERMLAKMSSTPIYK
jgi:hypothetical protein